MRELALVAEENEVEEILTKGFKVEVVDHQTLKDFNNKLQKIAMDAGNLEHIFMDNSKANIVADSDIKLIGKNYSAELLHNAVSSISVAMNEVAITINESSKGIQDMQKKQ